MEPIIIYTDGACRNNPGPAGIGIVLKWGEHTKQISEYIGKATNNIAELKAIEKSLLLLKKHNLPVKIYTDSIYALNVLTKGWKTKKNVELVQNIKNLINKFQNIKFIKVTGHIGDPLNEKADELARKAIEKHNL